jgi:hypothetical protein
MNARLAQPLLDEARTDLLTHHVSILVGSCSADCLPSVARAYGARVASDWRTVTVFLSVSQSEAVLRDLRAGGGISVVFSRPSTHHTVQLKGECSEITPIEADDRAVMRAYALSFRDEIAGLGFGGTFAAAIMEGVEGEAIAVTFAPAAAFEQTPGPEAGRRLDTAP